MTQKYIGIKYLSHPHHYIALICLLCNTIQYVIKRRRDENDCQNKTLIQQIVLNIRYILQT